MKSKEYIPSVAFSGAEKESMMTKTNSIGLILTSLPSSKRSMRSNVCVSPTSTYWTRASSLGKFPSACKHDAHWSDSLSYLFPCSFVNFCRQLNSSMLDDSNLLGEFKEIAHQNRMMAYGGYYSHEKKRSF